VDDHSSLFIGGGWRSTVSSEVITVVSPVTEQPIGRAPNAAEGDVDAAVAAARRALDPAVSPWARWDPAGRAEAMDRLADALDVRSQATARLVSSENGMPIAQSSFVEGVVPSAVLRYYSDLARGMAVEERRPAVGRPGQTLVRREPAGVVGAVVPWNSPSLVTSFKLAPALAAGCSVVLKPSPETALDAYLLADAVLEAQLPAGVVNIVPGDARAGAYLVAHPDVDKVAFTGSTAVGRQVGEVCGRLLRPVTLELGGKSAAIVLDDADLGSVARALVATSLLNNGQLCYLSTRILAPASRYDEVLDLVTEVAASLVVGDSLDPSVHVGPLVSRRHRDRVEGYIEAGRAAGAKITTGGGRPKGLETGWFVEPTVFTAVPDDASIVLEEIFGPVLTVLPYRDDDDAVAVANRSDYGLAGAVFTTDVERGLDIARRVRTGTFGINQYTPEVGSPFGGIKGSGLGRELGPEGLAAYQQLKSVYLA
jgi:acyl-CoA reductase-like NAD-dependent aldehyde dehydrogenase